MKLPMYLVGLVLATVLSGCVSGPTKPLTPLETQLVTQVMAKRLVATKLTPTQKEAALTSLATVKFALESTPSADVLGKLPSYFGPENQDVAMLLAVLLKERVDFSQLTELQGKEYFLAVLAGREGGLK